MALQSIPLWVPLQADGVTQVQHPAELLRALAQEVSTRSGVSKPGDFGQSGATVGTVVPAAMQLTLPAGAAFIAGRENTLQQAGSYFAYNQSSETISWPAAGGSNRMDSLILRVADPQYGSIGGNPLGAWWDAVAGSSASARPDSDFLAAGAKYVPGAWLRIADVLVPASATQLTQGNVTFKAGFANTMGYTPFLSTLRPAGLFVGERGFELDTGYGYQWNGTKWLRTEYAITVITDQSWTNNIVAADVTGVNTTPAGGFAFTMEANCRYDWEARIHSTAVSGVGLACQGSQPAGARSDAGILGVNNAGGFYDLAVQNATTATFGLGVQGNGLTVQRIGGTILCGGTPGTFKLQFSQGVSNGGASWLLIGSSFKHRQVS